MTRFIKDKDIETLWQRYSAEGVGKGISVAQYFESNGVPYHTFEKWYKKYIPNYKDMRGGYDKLSQADTRCSWKQRHRL